MTLTQLINGEGFAFNYQPSRIDRNALFALNRTFDPAKVSLARMRYHRAYLNYDSLLEDLMEYDCPKAKRTDDSAYIMAYESVRRELTPETQIIPLTMGAVANHKNFPNSKSPGLPYKTQGFATKREAIDAPGVLHDINVTWHHIGAGKAVELPDTCCYARAQICSREKNKIRAVWGYPLSLYMEEGRFFYPILEHLATTESPKIAYGLEISTGGMSYINSMCKDSPFILMGDWSKFDKTIPIWLIRDAFTILAQWIDFGQVRDSEGKIWHVRKDRSHRRWKKMVDYFCCTPVQLSDGKRFKKWGGVPSGSCFTNVIDSIVNMLVMRTCIYKLIGQLPTDDVYLGDDSVIALPRYVSPTRLKEPARHQHLWYEP
nr:TPA_asm: RdRp [Pseudoglobivirus]